MKIVKILSYTFFWISTYIIPKKNNLYIFVNTNWKTFSWNTKTIYKYILNNEKNIIPIYIWDNFIKSNSLKAYYYTIIAKYIFIENDLSQISNYILAYQPWNLNIINLWHWEPIKKIWFDANEKLYKKNMIWCKWKII